MRWNCSLLAVLTCTLTLSLVGCGGSDDTASVSPSPSPTVSPSASPTANVAQFVGNWSGDFHTDTDILAGFSDNPNTPQDESQQKIAIGGPATVTVASDGTLTADIENIAGESVGVLGPSAKGTLRDATVADDGTFTGTLTTDSGTDTVAGTLVLPQGTTNTLYIALSQTHNGVQHAGNMVLTKN